MTRSGRRGFWEEGVARRHLRNEQPSMLRNQSGAAGVTASTEDGQSMGCAW